MEQLKPGRYRHFKGKEYQLLYVAKHSETLEPMVVYRALYGEMGVWVRPAAMWTEQVAGTATTAPDSVRLKNDQTAPRCGAVSFLFLHKNLRIAALDFGPDI